MSEDPTGVVKPVADATKEVAIATGKGIDLVGSFGRFLDKTLGGTFQHGGGILADHVQHWRRMNLLRLQAKFNAACAEAGVTPDEVGPIEFGRCIDAVEAAANEEDEDVLELWARLLANAAIPNSGVAVRKLHVSLLKECGPAEVALLEALWKVRNLTLSDFVMPEPASHQPYARVAPIFAAKWDKHSADDKATAVANLKRLNCVEGAPFAHTVAHTPPSPTEAEVHGIVARALDNYSKGNSGPARLRSAPIRVKVSGPSRETVEVRGERVMLGTAAAFTSANKPLSPSLANIPELGFKLTALGQDLMRACEPTLDVSERKRRAAAASS